MLGPRGRVLHAIFVLSGAAGLGFQMASVRMFAVGLGHELPATLAVVGAFFGGLGIGAWAFDRTISRSRKPGHWYAALEGLIGLWVVACAVLATPANELALELMGPMPSALRQWAVSLGLPLLVLLPATAAMGATLPAMERFVSALAGGGRHVGGLYAANTFGAVVGTLLGAFLFVPMLGYRATLLCVAATNVACALLVLPSLREFAEGSTPLEPSPRREAARRAPREAASPPVARRGLLLILFATGLLGIGFEVVALRILAQVIENTVYSYAAILSVWLVGTAAGAAVYQSWQRSRDETRTAMGPLLCLLSASCVLGGLVFAASPEIYQFGRLTFGDTILGVLASELTIAAPALLLPTALMGATFSLLTQEAKTSVGGVGAALAANTAGGFLAPLVIGVVVMPLVGTRWALAAIALGYLALAALSARPPVRLVVAPLLLLLLLPDLRWIRTFEGQEVISYREGVMASVAILEDADGHRTLRVNNRFAMGGTGPRGERMQLRQGHIPLLLHPAPRSALYLGLGTGITALAATHHPGVQVDAVELVPEVVAALPAFEVGGRSLVEAPRARVHSADARRFVRTTPGSFDVIVADLFHPARDGGGMLYTREHFQSIRRRLAENGLFCQWLPMYQLDEPTLRDVIRTFLEVFPDARAVMNDVEFDLPAVGLIGIRGDWPRYGPGWMGRRVPSQALRRELAGIDLDTDGNLFGMLVAETAALRAYAGEGPQNTDDHPIVVYGAPHATVLRGQPRYGRLLALLREAPPPPTPWAIGDRELRQRLDLILRRRNEYMERVAAEHERGSSEPSRPEPDDETAREESTVPRAAEKA